MLLDATTCGLDNDGLRAWARAITRDTPYSSRSYRYPYALVARHREPVGVDLERRDAVEPAFADLVLTPDERRHVANDADLIDWWCSKEALAKALGDPLRYDPRRLDSPIRWPASRSGPWTAIPLLAPAGHAAWLCWLSDLGDRGAARTEDP